MQWKIGSKGRQVNALAGLHRYSIVGINDLRRDVHTALHDGILAYYVCSGCGR